MRWLWLGAGHLCVAIGFIGIFLPLLPTTPFLLLAAFCYSRGSEKFEHWLTTHPRLGPPILDWRRHRVIRPIIKAVAVTSLIVALAFPLYIINTPMWAKITAVIVISAVGIFILSCPSRSPERDEPSAKRELGS